MYGVWTMRRTNIYLDDSQLATLRALAERRGEPVAVLVRRALDEWLAGQSVAVIGEDEWERRFALLLARRRANAEERGLDESSVEHQVAIAVREVREARAARRR